MKTEEKNSNVQKVRIAVVGQMNVGKSGKLSNEFLIHLARLRKIKFDILHSRPRFFFLSRSIFLNSAHAPVTRSRKIP